MDKKICTFAERQTESKRKFEDTSRNTQNQQQQQQQNKRQNTGRAYTAGSIVHFARDYRSMANANNANNQKGTGSGQKPTCYECVVQGHFKRECPKLKNNNNRGNQVGGGNAPAKVYAIGHAGTNPDSNVVTGLAGYYRRFIEGFSKIAKPMTKLTQKKVKFEWGDKQETTFQLLKQKLGTSYALKFRLGKSRTFWKKEKSNPRYVGPFKVLEKVGSVAYKLELPEELSQVHNTFHVSNLKKCHADEPLAVRGWTSL
ncbi:putative reverse transcriptase domain-containing protein [Tanacetum coccineum]